MITSGTPLKLTETDMPALYTAANTGAIRSQKTFFRLVMAELIAISVAALAQVAGRQWGLALANALNFSVGDIQVLGFDFTKTELTNIVATYILPAIVMLFAMGFLGWRAVKRDDKLWRGRRAIAEATKAMAWRYSMQALPAEIEAGSPFSAQRADDAFQHELDQLIEQSASLNLPAPGPKEVMITQKMRDLRQADQDAQRDAYLEGRLRDQQSWYAKRSGRFEKMTNRFQWARFGAYVLGFILILLPGLGTNALGIMTTIAGAFATWQAGKHYEDLSQSYGTMSRRLGAMAGSATNVPPSGGASASASAVTWPQFVDKVETVMEGEHQDWLRLTKKA